MGVTVEALRPVLAEALGSSLDRLDAHPLSAGASRLTWALDAYAGGTVHRLVLQRERVAGRGRMPVETEAHLLTSARAAGVPVPSVVAHGSTVDGSYVVTSRVDGETIPRRILRDPALATARAQFAAECGRILAHIGQMPTDGLSTEDPLDLIEHMLDRSLRRPAFELALRWLRTHRPADRRAGVVHGDFRLGNLIVGPDGVRAVLDWELAHLGDPREDLGWLCARVWRFGAPGVVGGMGTVAELLDAYERNGGFPVEDLSWWQLLATLRWGAICLEQARVHLSGEFRSVELATIGRRAAEMEYELMRMVP